MKKQLLTAIFGLATLTMVNAQNKALNFDGTNNFITTTAQPSDVSFTVEAWINPSSYTTSTSTPMQRTIAATEENNSGNKGWVFRLTSAGKLDMTLPTSNGAGWINTYSSGTVALNTWTHVAAVVTTSGSTSKITFYINGVAETEQTVSSFTGFIGNSSQKMLVGESSFSGRKFYGAMDEFRYYNTAKSADVILTDYRGETTDAINGVLVYYKMNESTGTTILGSNGFNGTFNGTISNSATTPPFATRFYVDGGLTTNGVGNSWATGFKDLNDALVYTFTNEIWVKKGTYKPTRDNNFNSTPTDPRDKMFYAPYDLNNMIAKKIYGGFAGTETTLSERDYINNVTKLTGDLNSNDVISGSGNTLSITSNSENSYHVFYGSYADLDGFVITGGNANVATYDSKSIIRNSAGGFTANSIKNCVITGNAGVNYAGGNASASTNNFYINNLGTNDSAGSGTFVNCVFSGNKATGKGVIYYRVDENAERFFRNNTVYNNDTATGSILNLIYSPNMDFAPGSFYLYNNLFYGNSVAGSTSANGVDFLTANGIQVTAKNNSFQLPSNSYTSANSKTLTANSGNLFQKDPIFVDASSLAGSDGKYFTSDDGLDLQITSPVANLGDKTLIPATVTKDLGGNDRVFSSNVDMGAYESESTEVLAINNTTKEKNKLFPNPTSGIVNITTDSNADVQIYSLDGKMIQSQKITKGTSTVDLTSKNSGVYLIKVGDQTYKVIKK